MNEVRLFISEDGLTLNKDTFDKIPKIKGELAEKGLPVYASWVDHSHGKTRVYLGNCDAERLDDIQDILKKYGIEIENA